MAAFLLYQLKAAVLLAVFFLGYRLLLGRETFHRFNRAVLIAIAVLSFVLPFIHVTRHVDNPPETAAAGLVQEEFATADDSGAAAGFQAADIPALPVLSDDIDYGEPAPDASAVTSISERRSMSDMIVPVLFVLYWIGFAFVIVRKVLSVSSMLNIIRTGRYANRLDGCDVIESDRISQPLSWMRFIVMPHEWLEHENAMVWKHENLHASRLHSLDLLMADMMTAFQWFNPVTAALHKEFEVIHEYEADQAVIQSGADDTQYKLILVQAVASSRGMAMTNWLKQSNLKKRIDMMEKKQSDGRNRLKALYIPAVMCLFLFANATKVYGEENSPVTEQFENHVVWVFDNGSAKVGLDNAEPADMKLDDVPGYLKKHRKKGGITRVTLRYMYDIAGLADVQPLAEKLSGLGIRVSVANNDGMLEKIFMPEYRCARIYDEGGGQYRFELNCHSSDENRRIRESVPYQFRDENGNVIGSSGYADGRYESPISDLSVTGDIELMKKWIGMFDGHGVGIYPVDMPYSDAEQMAQAAWKRGIAQVSLVSGYSGNENGGMLFPTSRIVLIPQGSEWSLDYPEDKAIDVLHKRETAVGWGYLKKGTVISNPRTVYNSNTQDFGSINIVKTPDELIVVYNANQGSDLWLTGFGSMELVAGDRRYRQTGYEGLDGFEKALFWSPDYGQYVQSMHFEPVPDDVKVVDLYDRDLNATVIKGMQVSDDLSYFDKIRTVRVLSGARLKTTHVNESLKDEVLIERIDLTGSETTVYLTMIMHEPRSFKGHVGSDFVLRLHDGTELRALRIDGVPVDRDFDRNGDNVDTPFQIIFPPLPKNTFNNDGITLSGTVCHEPLKFSNLQNLEIANLRATLPDFMERDNDYFINYFSYYRNLKALLSNINDSNLFGGDSPLCLTMQQRKEILDKLAIGDGDIDRLASAQCYIIIHKRRFISIADEEHGHISMNLPLGSIGGVQAPTDPYEYLRSNPNIKTDDEGNWYAYGRKAEIMEIGMMAGDN